MIAISNYNDSFPDKLNGPCSKRDEENIAREARLDGIYVIRARNISEEEIEPPKLVSTYKSLAKVDSAFRRLKTTALLVRPIFHYQSDMVRAHIFLCMLAYYVQWEMEKQPFK